MRKYNLPHPLILSFYSPSLYRDVAREWNGGGFLYLLLLLALSWIPAMVVLHRAATGLIKTFGPAILEQVPTIAVHDGKVTIREPQPYVIQLPGSEHPDVIIDTTGQTTLENTPAMVTLTQNQLIFKKSPGETRIYDLTAVRSFTVDRARMERIFQFLQKWIAVAAYPFALLCSYAYRIVQVLVYAGIGLFFARLLKVSLDYPALLRLSSVAITPAVWLDTLRGWLGYPTRFAWWSLCFGAAMGYLFFALRANSSDEALPDGPELRGSSPER